MAILTSGGKAWLNNRWPDTIVPHVNRKIHIYNWKKKFSLFTAVLALGTLPEPDKLAGVPTFSMAKGGNEAMLTTSSKSTMLPSPMVVLQETNPPNVLSLGIPLKLSRKILDLEYVEMSELLPEMWGLDLDTATSCCHDNRRQTRRGPVTDILLWIECYSSMVAVLATRFPQHIGDLMSYQKTIIKACKNFEGTAWVIYDRCYRRRAAATKSLEWAKIDSALHNEAFTGRARVIPRCQFCLSDSHLEHECPDKLHHSSSYSGWGLGRPNRWSSPPNRLQSYSGHRAQMGRPTHALHPTSQEVCQLFNRAQCKAIWCKRRHVCNHCGLPHPEVLCAAQADRQHRPRSPRDKGAKTV